MNWSKWKARLKFTIAFLLFSFFMLSIGFGGVIQSMDVLPEFDGNIDEDFKDINSAIAGFQKNVTVREVTSEGEVSVGFEGGANVTTPLTGVKIVNTVENPNEFGVNNSAEGRYCIQQVVEDRDKFVEKEIIRENAYYSIPSFDNETNEIESFSFVMQANQWENEDEVPENPVYISVLFLEKGYAVPSNIEDSDGEKQVVEVIQKAQREERGIWQCTSEN